MLSSKHKGDMFGWSRQAKGKEVHLDLRYQLHESKQPRTYDVRGCFDFTELRNPIGQYIYNQIRVFRIICFQMHSKVVRTIHAFVHHEDAGFNDRAFAGLEYHRTDGQVRRSAALQYFDVRVFLEAQRAIACVGDFDGKGFIDAEFHITIIDLLLIYSDGWNSIPIATALIGKEECSHDQQDAAH